MHLKIGVWPQKFVRYFFWWPLAHTKSFEWWTLIVLAQWSSELSRNSVCLYIYISIYQDSLTSNWGALAWENHKRWGLLRPQVFEIIVWTNRWATFKNSMTSLSRDSHVTKISKSNSELTIAVRAYYSHTYESLVLLAFTRLVKKNRWCHYHVIVTWSKFQSRIAREP